MISIAICDDDNDFRLLLRDAVYKMIESHGEQAVIEDFSDGQTCLSQLGSRKFNILFLDIEMPGMDGFSMAGKMQKSYPNIVLIFVSSHESLVFQSYEYDTFWFMRKSALITDLKKAIDKYFARIVYNELYYVVNAQKVYYKDILYIECNGHLITIKTADRTYSMCGSLKKLEEELTPYQFIRVHKSFLVNMKQIN
ncbi:LytR/AlgR family response regulator transcription factor, partial [Hungatella effluvii]